jgi:hypothetical protein
VISTPFVHANSREENAVSAVNYADAREFFFDNPRKSVKLAATNFYPGLFPSNTEEPKHIMPDTARG